MLSLRVLVRAAQCTRRLALHGGVVDRYELQLATIKAMSRRGGLFDALHRISAEPVSISQDPSVNRDDAIERVTRRGLPKHGVTGVEV